MVIVAQGELVGNPFARNFHLRQGDRNILSGQQRQVRITAALNEEAGEMKFEAARLTPIAVSLILHIPLASGTIFDLAFQKPSLTTAKKHGASTTGVNMDAVWRSRGGDPDYHPIKSQGFGFQSTPSEIVEERRRKKQQSQNPILYQAHP